LDETARGALRRSRKASAMASGLVSRRTTIDAGDTAGWLDRND
jgi:hypothetical protein